MASDRALREVTKAALLKITYFTYFSKPSFCQEHIFYMQHVVSIQSRGRPFRHVTKILTRRQIIPHPSCRTSSVSRNCLDSANGCPWRLEQRHYVPVFRRNDNTGAVRCQIDKWPLQGGCRCNVRQAKPLSPRPLHTTSDR